MSWIFIAISGYFLLAIEAVASKFLLTGRVKDWKRYSVYVGLLSAIGFFVALIGFFNPAETLQWKNTETFLTALLSGVMFFLGLVFLYRSLQFSSASRVYVLFGAVVTVFSYLFGLFLIGEKHGLQSLLGIFLLVIGGALISYKFQKRKFFSTFKFVIVAGILVAFSLVLLKFVYDQQNFVSGYVYSRAGMFLSAVVFLSGLLITGKKVKKKKPSKKQRNKKTADVLGILGAKTIAGIGSILVYYAIFLGSVTIVNALVSVQYLFTFLLVIIFAFYIKSLREDLTFWNIVMKSVGVLVVVAGVFLISI